MHHGRALCTPPCAGHSALASTVHWPPQPALRPIPCIVPHTLYRAHTSCPVPCIVLTPSGCSSTRMAVCAVLSAHSRGVSRSASAPPGRGTQREHATPRHTTPTCQHANMPTCPHAHMPTCHMPHATCTATPRHAKPRSWTRLVLDSTGPELDWSWTRLVLDSSGPGLDWSWTLL